MIGRISQPGATALAVALLVLFGVSLPARGQVYLYENVGRSSARYYAGQAGQEAIDDVHLAAPGSVGRIRFGYYDPDPSPGLEAEIRIYANPGGADNNMSLLAGPYVVSGLAGGMDLGNLTLSPAVYLDGDCWVGIRFNRHTAGVLLDDSYNLGSSHDFYVENQSFYWFGGDTPANFALELTDGTGTFYNASYCQEVAGTLDIHWEWIDEAGPICDGIEYTDGDPADASDGEVSFQGIAVENPLCIGMDMYNFAISANTRTLMGDALAYQVPMTLHRSENEDCFVGDWVTDGYRFRAHISAAPFLGATAAPEPSRGALELYGNYPNPFNPATSIAFRLGVATAVNIDILDARGRLVRRLLSGTSLPAGPHDISWDGRGADGERVPSGVYRYLIRTQVATQSGAMVLLK